MYSGKIAVPPGGGGIVVFMNIFVNTLTKHVLYLNFILTEISDKHPEACAVFLSASA
jgi:hypothetical protein